MAWGLELPAAPPAGLRMESSWDGTRVVLRPTGAARWVGVVFLCFWLCGWAAGEIFALTMLLGGIGAALGLGGIPRSTLPPGEAGLAVGGFLLFWLTFWTFGGVAAFITAVRTGWGSDIFLIRPGEWSLRQAVGSCGRTRPFVRGAVQRIFLRRKDQALAADVDGKEVVLSSFGTHEERRWLRDALRQALGIPVDPAPQAAAQERTTASLPASLPKGWVQDAAEDGSVRLTLTGSRLAGAGCVLVPALFWNGIVGTIAAQVIRQGLRSWPEMLFLIPFLAVGLGLLALFVWALFGKEEWRARRNALEVRRTFFGYVWRRCYADGALAIDTSTDSDGDQSWTLVVEAGSQKRMLQNAGYHADTNGKLAELRALGSVLSYYTGWSFRQPAPDSGSE